MLAEVHVGLRSRRRSALWTRCTSAPISSLRAILLALSFLPFSATARAETTDPDQDPESQQQDEASVRMEPVDVVIEGKRRSRPLDTATVTDVQGDRLRRSASPSTFEAIARETPGLFVTSRGVGFHGVASGASGGLHLRGLGGSPNTQVLVVEDGVPDYQGLFGHPIPDAYSSFLVERVRVLRGGDSVLYGTNALGGVILIESRRRHQPGWELQNDLAYGSFRTMRESLALLTRQGEWEATGAFSALRSDGHRAGAGGTNEILQLTTRWHALRTTQVALSHKRFHGTGSDPGPITHPTPDHGYDVRRSTTSLQLNGVMRGVVFRGVQYVNEGTHRLYDGFYSNDHTAGAHGQAEFEVTEGLRSLVGMAGDTVGGTVEDRAALERQQVSPSSSVSGFGQLMWQPTGLLEMVSGGRAMVSSEYGAVALYKLGLRAKPWREIAVHTRVARNFRQPTLREKYLPFPSANPDLRPEYATTWDVGLSVHEAPLQAEAVLFALRATDLIRTFGAYPTAEVVNIDTYDTWGVEASVGLGPVGPLSARLQGSWQDVGRYTKQNPSHQAGLSVDVSQPMGAGTLMGEISGEWVAGLYQNNYQRDPMDDVYFVDATLRWVRPLPDRSLTLEPYVVTRNLLNQEYEYVPGYRMPGRHWLAGMKVTL